MDLKALIEFNKYTIALSAACFAYAIDKLAPVQSSSPFVLFVVGVFFLCILSGVIVFASATSALHEEKKDKVPTLKRVIVPLGTTHIVLLVVGILTLGGLVLAPIVASVGSATATVCCEACKKPLAAKITL